MKAHEWGDEDFDWNSLYNAERDLSKILRFFRIGANTKEKYGSLRASVYFWDGGLHQLIWPGYVYVQNKILSSYIDRFLIKPFTKYTGLLWIGTQIQYFGFKIAYAYIMLKYSHIVDELTCDADHYELLWNGEKLKNKFWTSYIIKETK